MTLHPEGHRRIFESRLRTILRDTSRSFYLSIRVLPREIEFPIGLAYLLARAADTIADTNAAAIEKRRTALESFLVSLETNSAASRSGLSKIIGDASDASAAEKILLSALPDLWSLYDSLEPALRAPTKKVLSILIGGMLHDLSYFSGNSPRPLATRGDTDLYTFEVAGCVGEFWSEILCQARLRKKTPENLIRWGVLFGKGLQRINILRDLPKDLAQGRCYLSEEILTEAGLSTEDLCAIVLHKSGSDETLRRFYGMMAKEFAQTKAFLSSGLRYVLALPTTERRLRLAAFWPLLIGLHTLRAMEAWTLAPDPDHPAKIPRALVRQILWRSLWKVSNNASLQSWCYSVGGIV